MTQLETRLIGTAPKQYDLKMSRTTKNYLAGLDLAERVRTVEFIKTLPKRHQDKIQDFLESSPHRHAMMMYIMAADEA